MVTVYQYDERSKSFSRHIPTLLQLISLKTSNRLACLVSAGGVDPLLLSGTPHADHAAYREGDGPMYLIGKKWV